MVITCYNYHKPKREIVVYVHQLNAIFFGPHIVGLKVGLVPSQFQKVGWKTWPQTVGEK